ncbi:MAG: magnesium transporter CorA [Oscillatoriales cyanobacterium RM2_1_1]|nr:magnesium transporter CorA [Oscillatoriales cyanobacterium SM2_3_0]NJO44871.1 magnesium transporter CorA [Oscillatoriales cyanobacterium RM2_1_1]
MSRPASYVTLISFSPTQLNIQTIWEVEETLQQIDPTCQNWLRCVRIRNVNEIARLVQFFQLQSGRVSMIRSGLPSGIDDEETEDCFFGNYEVISPQVKSYQFDRVRGSYALGQNFLLTFESDEFPVFEHVIHKIQKGTLSIQNHQIDYLLYLIHDEILSRYESIFDRLGRELDDLEDQVLENTGGESTYRMIASLKQSTRLGRRNFQAIRNLVALLNREDIPWISQPVAQLFQQKLIHEVDELWQEYQSLRDWMYELIEIQRDNLSRNTNRVINQLTVVSSIFLPLSFLAGLYGMNFENMPELEIPWAYPALLCVMAVIALGGFIYTKKLKL